MLVGRFAVSFGPVLYHVTRARNESLVRCGGRPLGIVNTHITADVDAGDVKLWQAMCMLGEY